MQLSEIRKTVRLSMGAQEGEFDDTDVDRALRLCLNEAQKICQFSRSSATANLKKGIAEFTVSDPQFAPERVLQVEVGYEDRGVWAVGQSYVERDLVQGDGTPDSLLYVCLKAHTSDSGNEPPQGDGVWVNVPWRRGTPVNRIGFGLMQSSLASGRDGAMSHDIQGASLYHGVPHSVAWSTDQKGYVFPVPLFDCGLVLTYAKPLPTWTPGTKASVDLEIPDEYIHPLIWFGVPGALMFYSRGETDANANWERFKQALFETMGRNTPDTGQFLMDVRKY